MNSHILGIAGGSGSGKSTFVANLFEILGKENCLVIRIDDYYKDLSSKFDKDGGQVNFDDPQNIDFDLLEIHLKRLRNGLLINIPIYDYCSHKRLNKSNSEYPRHIIIVEGIFALAKDSLLSIYDESIFIDSCESLRFQRRLNRDLTDRGRTIEGVVNQYFNHVRPMHYKHVEPCLLKADTIIREENIAKIFSSTVTRLRNMFV